MKHETKVERTSDRELVVTRRFEGPAEVVFAAWTRPELIERWWVPKSCGVEFVSCEVDARSGGKYRFVFRHPEAPEPMAFFGKYVEVVPNAKIVWTNEEAADGAVSTVTFEERDGGTWQVLYELYPSKEALDEAIASGSTSGAGEQHEQLDALLEGLVQR